MGMEVSALGKNVNGLLKLKQTRFLKMTKQRCPCGSRKIYTVCCGPYLAGMAFPNTPEQLMRSRYTAYATGNLAYIQQTMLAPAATHFSLEEAEERAKQVDWIELNVIKSSQEKNSGLVEFAAVYIYQQQKYVLHELSEFKRENGKWFYIDGKIFS